MLDILNIESQGLIKEIIKQAIRKMKVAGQRKIDEGNRMIKQADDLENEII